MKSAANRATGSAKNNAAIAQSATTMRCGMTSSSRKNTVSRDRRRSSVTTKLIGCDGTGGSMVGSDMVIPLSVASVSRNVLRLER